MKNKQLAKKYKGADYDLARNVRNQIKKRRRQGYGGLPAHTFKRQKRIYYWFNTITTFVDASKM